MKREIWIWRPTYYRSLMCVSTQKPHWVKHMNHWSSADKVDVTPELVNLFLGEPVHKLIAITKPEKRWLDGGKVEP